MNPRKFDVIVIGSGSGLKISSMASSLGLKVAVLEKSEFGGTCLNRGCIPSKILIHTADIVESINDSEKFGIKARVESIDWKSIQKRVWSEVDSESNQIEKGNKSSKNITVFKGTASFIEDKVIKINNNLITADKIFICAGTRPFIPKINGLDKIKYYTSDDVMRLKTQPKSMAIMGGGYIAAELSHFFSSMGTKVTLINRGDKLLKNEDFDISEKFTKIVSKKFNVLLNTQIEEVSSNKDGVSLSLVSGKKKSKLDCEVFLIATGRVPNSDILNLKNTKINLNENGYVKVNEFMETSVPGVWSIGDIAGIYLFKHSANLEAIYAANNAFTKNRQKVDYTAMPHAVFASPQIAGVGLTEQEAKEKKIDYISSKYEYIKTGMGLALLEKEGFIKILLDKKTRTILGCHIMGYDASTLIHEVILAMRNKLSPEKIVNTVHIHPALSEVVQRAFSKI